MAIGGVVFPIGLGVYCATVLNDLGGPLFLPFIAIIGAFAGLLAGGVLGTVIHIGAILWRGRA